MINKNGLNDMRKIELDREIYNKLDGIKI